MIKYHHALVCTNLTAGFLGNHMEAQWDWFIDPIVGDDKFDNYPTDKQNFEKFMKL